jgi:hypothetical protein
MRIIYLLCRVLQQKSLDILNAMDLISTTKALLWTLRDVKFDLLFAHVQMFAHVQYVCTQYEIDIPHMNTLYKKAIRSFMSATRISDSLPTLSLRYI